MRARIAKARPRRTWKGKWFWFQSYDRRSSGIVSAKDLEEVCKLAGSEEIRIWAADWDGQEFRKGHLLKKRASFDGQQTKRASQNRRVSGLRGEGD